MAKKLAAHIAVYDDNGQLVQLKPGDEVPSWATDKVGDHVYEEEQEQGDPYEDRDDLNPDGGNDLTPTANPDLIGETERPAGEEEPPADEGTPDFTKPAAKRGSKK